MSFVFDSSVVSAEDGILQKISVKVDYDNVPQFSEPQNSSSEISTPAEQPQAVFGDFSTAFSAQNDSSLISNGSVGANIYLDNNRWCKNSFGSGSTCDGWRDNCQTTSSYNSGVDMHNYHEVKDSFHGGSADVTMSVDAVDPDGNNICWNSPCTDKVTSRYQINGDYAWFCWGWNFWDINKPGTWQFIFESEDHKDGNRKTTKYMNVDILCTSSSQCSGNGICDSGYCKACNVDSVEAYSSTSSYACDANLVTYHKFKNKGTINTNYDIYFYLYDPAGTLVASTSELGKALNTNSEVNWEVTWYPPASGWAKKGTYSAKAKLVAKCGSNDNAEAIANPNIPSAPCPKCTPRAEWSKVLYDNSCNSYIKTEHMFSNPGDTVLPYDVKAYLYDSNGNQVVASATSTGHLYPNEPEGGDKWWISWSVPSGGWKKSGTYTSKMVLSGTCNGKAVSAETSAYPQMPLSCGQTTATCNGKILTYASDSYGNPMQGIKIYADNAFKGTTDSNGYLSVSTSDSTCGQSHKITAYCQNDNYCSEQSAKINFNNQQPSLSFTCNSCIEKSLNLEISKDASSYCTGDTISISATVKDRNGNAVSGADLQITDNLKSRYVQKFATDINGKASYSTVAGKTGSHEIILQASKQSYEGTYGSTTANVKDCTSSIYLDIDGKGNVPLPGAVVYLDDQSAGTTDSNGKMTIKAKRGTRSVEAFCPYDSLSCGKTSINLIGDKSIDIDCNSCEKQKGNLRVAYVSDDGNPVGNVQLFLDSEGKGMSNIFGNIDVGNTYYGAHNLVSVFSDNNGKQYCDSRSINLNQKLHVEKITTSIAKFDDNCNTVLSEDIEPNIVILAPALVVFDYASIAWSSYELAKCLDGKKDIYGTKFDKTKFNNACTDTESAACKSYMSSFPTDTMEQCSLEFVALGADIGTPLIPAGAIILVVGNTGKFLAKIPGVEKIFSFVKDGAGKTFTFVTKKGEEAWDWFGTGVRKVFKPIKGVLKESMEKVVKEHYAQIQKNVDNFLKHPGDLTKAPLKNKGELRGWLAEQGADKGILKETADAIPAGKKVIRSTDINAISKKLNLPIGKKVTRGDYLYELTSDGELKIFCNSGDCLKYWDNGNTIGDVDRMMFVDNELSLFEIKGVGKESSIVDSMKVETTKGSLHLGDSIKEKLLKPMEALTNTRPSFSLLKVDDVPISETGEIATAFNELKDYGAKYFPLGANYDQFTKAVETFTKEGL